MLADSPVMVVGEAATGVQAVELARELRPDVILLDIRMPDLDGLAALREIKRDNPRLRVVMLTAYDNPAWFVQAVAYGAAGYLLKSMPREELVSTLQAVVAGDALVSPAHLSQVIHHLGAEAGADADSVTAEVNKLTEREREVLALLTEGLTNRQIADTLGVAASTIKTHVQNIMLKTGASDRTQAAVIAVRAGIARRKDHV